MKAKTELGLDKFLVKDNPGDKDMFDICFDLMLDYNQNFSDDMHLKLRELMNELIINVNHYFLT